MEDNKSIKVEDLQIGDEVIVTGLRYLKILKDPVLRTNPGPWGGKMYKNIKCMDLHFSKFNIGADRQVYYDFNYKNIWLIKKGKI